MARSKVVVVVLALGVATAAAEPETGRVKGWSWAGGQDLAFVDGGAALLLSAGSALTLVDPQRREVVDSLELGSARVPDRSGTPGDNPTLEQLVYRASWAWDATQRTLVGAVCVGGSGQIERRLSVWRPGVQPPVPVTGVAPGAECRPLAIAADASVFLARTAPATVQLYTVASSAPSGAPITLAHDPSVAVVAPGGAWLAMVDAAGDVEVYETAARRLDALARGRNQRVQALALDPTRPVLVVLGDVEAVAWDLRTRTPTQLGDNLVAAAYSADGRYFAVATSDKVTLRAGATLQPAQSFDARGVQALAFAPDATRLAVQTQLELQLRELGPARAPTAATTFDRRWFDQLAPLPVPAAAPEPAFVRDGVVEVRVVAAGRPVAGTAPSGPPVAGAEVRLVPLDREWPHARALAPIIARTGADGRVRLTQVPRIDWLLSATAVGMTRAGWTVELRKQPRSAPEVRLEPAVTIHGLVVGPDGRPAGNARVLHARTQTDDEVGLTTSPDGTFTIDHLARGTDTTYGRDGYELQAWRSDGAVVTSKTLFKPAGPTKLTLQLVAPGDPRVTRLKLVDEDGAPVREADVELGHGVSHASNAQGLFSTDVPPRVISGPEVDVRVTVDHMVIERKLPWPVSGVATVAIRRRPPPGTLLPLACVRYRDAIAKVARCDRVPRATREALQAELARSEATWADHPERVEFECSMGDSLASSNARLCH